MALPLEDRRILFAVPPARFDEAQLYQTWQLLAEVGAWMVLGADSPTGVAVGESGTVEKVSRALRDAKPDAFDAVLFVAGQWEKGEAQAVADRFPGLVIAAFRGVHVKADVVGTIRSLDRFIAELEVALSKRPARAPQVPAQI